MGSFIVALFVSTLNIIMQLLRFLGILALLISVSWAQNPRFESYKSAFAKRYSSPREYLQRKAIFEANLQIIENHNKRFQNGEVDYEMAVNQFTDLTQQEFVDQILGLPELPKNPLTVNEESLKVLREKYANFNFKENFNWVDEGIVTSVKDQGQCGSCTAFAVTGSIESCFAQKSGVVFDDLSEQFLVDCAYGYDDGGFDAQGCQGAWPQAYYAYLYEQTNGQHQMEENYPYTARNGECVAEADGFYTGGEVTDQLTYWGSNEDDLKMLLVEYGPVVTTLAADWLSLYGGGIFNSFLCCNAANGGDSCTNGNNHAVLVVGYGSENGKDYWLVKNSWGSRFGNDGFFKIKRGVGHCGFGWQMNSVPLC